MNEKIDFEEVSKNLTEMIVRFTEAVVAFRQSVPSWVIYKIQQKERSRKRYERMMKRKRHADDTDN